MNSNQKGKRAERSWVKKHLEHGFNARRGRQYSGGSDSPDVVCDELFMFHPECKHVERLNIHDAMAQAVRDCGDKIPYVAHKKNHTEWLVTMRADDWFELVREAI